MPVVSIRKGANTAPAKSVKANQKAIDLLPLASGPWRVEGVPGLYLRCRAKSRSFFVQRRVRGKLVKETLGQLSMKQAREKAMRIWSGLKPKPAAHEVVTFGAALEQYIEDQELAPATAANYRYNAERYLEGWTNRSFEDIGKDRAGVRWLVRRVTKTYGKATANQVNRLISAVYRWQRKQDVHLPEPPTTAVEVYSIAARDWAFTPDELKAWWSSAAKDKDGKPIARGVKTLGPIKRMWWITALLTGARRGSIEALRWQDIDFDKKIIKFTVAKGVRVYSVPMADKLANLLIACRDSSDIPPSPWVFPSNVIDGAHITAVRNQREGVAAAHHLRHSYRTVLTELGATRDQARLLMGHSLGSDVSSGYISAPLVVESL